MYEAFFKRDLSVESLAEDLKDLACTFDVRKRFNFCESIRYILEYLQIFLLGVYQSVFDTVLQSKTLYCDDCRFKKTRDKTIALNGAWPKVSVKKYQRNVEQAMG